jgi:DNA-binding MarR family transcriptional regulator
MTLTKSAEMPVEEYLCLALYTASRSVTGLYRDLLDELGLTYPQYLVMSLLWQKGPQQVKQIASILQLDYGTLSPLLKRLEAAGLLTRARRRDDERSVEIALTQAGQAMRAQAETVPDRVICALGLDDRAGRELLQTLRNITSAVNGTTGQRPGDRASPRS